MEFTPAVVIVGGVGFAFWWVKKNDKNSKVPIIFCFCHKGGNFIMTNESFGPADYAAMSGNNGNGIFGDNGLWLIVLLLFFGGWGNGNGYGGANAGGGFYPDMQRGFDQSAVMSGIAGINQSLAAAEVSRCNGQMNILQAMNNNQANLTSQLFGMAQTQQNCCCDAKMQVADLKSTVLSENCADRYEAANNTRDIMSTVQSGNQAIIDKLCQLELDGIKQNYENRIATMQATMDSLRDEVNAQNRMASQNAQTAQIINALNPAPIPSYNVPAPYGCNCNSGCGCNGNF